MASKNSRRVAVDGKNVVTSGRLFKTARLQSEAFVYIDEPQSFLSRMKEEGVRADLFTFIQPVGAKVFDTFHREFDEIAVLHVSTYDNWFNNQIRFKPRNKLRKALKSGIEVKVVEFNDELVRGIVEIYNETPIRQGKRNWHYGKDFETIKRESSNFLDRSDFIGVYFRGELIGFAKVTYSGDCAVFMNIVSKETFRDKAPSNALIAKTVELCEQKSMRSLVYGVWGGRGLTDFKVANAFERYELPRYFVPLGLKGKLMLKLGLHRNWKTRIPRKYLDKAAALRAKWYARIFKRKGAANPEAENERSEKSMEPIRGMSEMKSAEGN